MSSDTSNILTLEIDGSKITVPKGTTVYNAAKQLGIDIPIFCYHDRMPPFGACRMCLVEVENIPKLQAACTLEVREGMVVHTQNSQATQGRKEILELLLINHPLDCPICDKGGECPLQDNTLEWGPGKSRFFEEKRHFKKPKPLGPVLMLDRERCITCARCTRFGELIASDNALELIDRGYRTEVGTPTGGPAKSKFIGNTIMICPVGALTSQVYRFRARPWDNDSTDSTCTLCPVGCSLIFDSRDGEVMRTRSRENKKINDIWLCDKGWFGYEFADHPDRLTTPLIRQGAELIPATWDEALTRIAKKIRDAKADKKVAGWGGNPLTLEENYLFQQLMRQSIGVNHVDHRIGMPIHQNRDDHFGMGMHIDIDECEELSFAVLFGIDLTEEFPVIWLRLKQAINRGAKVLFFGHYAPEISPHLYQTVLHSPGDELKTLQEYGDLIAKMGEQEKKCAFFVGRQYLATEKRREILSEIRKLKNESTSLNLLEGNENSMGAYIAGMRPDSGPLEIREEKGLNYIEVLNRSAAEGWDLIYIAGANPARHVPSQLWEGARENLGFLVVQDLFLTETALQADVVLPTLCFIEKRGHFINIAGKLERLEPGKVIPQGILSDEEIFIKIAQKLNSSLFMDEDFLEQVHERKWIRETKEGHSQSKDRIKDQDDAIKELKEEKNLRASFSCRLFNKGTRMQHNHQLAKLVETPYVRIHPEDGNARAIPSGTPVKIKAHQEDEGRRSFTATLIWDEKVAKGGVVIPLGFPEIPQQELGENLLNGLPIYIEKKVGV